MQNLILVIGICMLLSSCKKDNDTPGIPDPVTYDSYSNLRKGNYWVYERFELDTIGGTYTSLNVFDSSYVEKDTVVNGNTYYKLMQINYPYSNEYAANYLRDSLNYIVNIEGNVQFASQNFSDVFFSYYYISGGGSADTISYMYSKMADDNVTINVPAGNFVTKNFKTTYRVWPAYAAAGSERPKNYRCAKDIGLVEQTLPFFITSPSYIVRRLTRYGSD